MIFPTLRSCGMALGRTVHIHILDFMFQMILFFREKYQGIYIQLFMLHHCSTMSVYLYTGYRGYHARQDKQELLAQWIRCGENIKVMETTLVIQRSQQGELTRGRELLTIAEMQSRGFSKTPANTI